MADTDGVLVNRNVGGIVAQVVVSEAHVDELTITEQPVEQGAAVTDHAFKQPAKLTVVVGWSSSNPDGTDVRDVYQKLLALQASRSPLDVVTGKRSYKDMLIESLATETEQATENALIVTVTLRQVILVSTETSNLSSTSNQADPSATGAINDKGTVQAAPASANSGAAAGGLPATATV